MKNSRLIQSVSLLSSLEKKQFLRFVKSPFFNTDDNLIKITQILCQDDLSEVTRESVFKQLFPKIEFDYFRISNLFSLIMKLLEEFHSTVPMRWVAPTQFGPYQTAPAPPPTRRPSLRRSHTSSRLR